MKRIFSVIAVASMLLFLAFVAFSIFTNDLITAKHSFELASISLMFSMIGIIGEETIEGRKTSTKP